MKALEQAKQLLEAEVRKMTQVITSIEAVNGGRKAKRARVISAAGKRRIAAAARARWARVRAAQKRKAA